MSESRTIYVVTMNRGCEGYGQPLKAFASRFLADIFVAGAEAAYSHGMEVIEMPLVASPHTPR